MASGLKRKTRDEPNGVPDYDYIESDSDSIFFVSHKHRPNYPSDAEDEDNQGATVGDPITPVVDYESLYPRLVALHFSLTDSLQCGC